MFTHVFVEQTVVRLMAVYVMLIKDKKNLTKNQKCEEMIKCDEIWKTKKIK